MTVRKKISAPLSFVFYWCTDYQADDPKLTGSTYRRTILEKSGAKALYIDEDMVDGRKVRRRALVTLSSPDSWHVESIGNDRDTSGDYLLFPDGKGTRLEMTFDTTYKIGRAPTKEERAKTISEFWHKLAANLEKDYRTLHPSR